MNQQTAPTTQSPLLKVLDLRTYFDTDDGVVKAVDGVSFRIERRQTFALVGESGCGKSVTAMTLMRLVACPPGRIVGGAAYLDGQNLLTIDESRMRQVRGKDISMVFQEPMTSLNPVYTVGWQIVEAIELHQNIHGAAAWDLAAEMLARVGIPEPVQRVREYPHQLSGGMRQRIMIAMALSCNPQLLIADEPTTALDVTIQAQILDLLKELQRTAGLSILLITHDLGVVAESAEVVGVMYAGRLVELTDVRTLFAKPLHPYTQGLFRSLPRLGPMRKRLETIEGAVPNPARLPSGCPFHPRCPVGHNLPRCQGELPPLREIDSGHWAACWEAAGYAEAKETSPAEKRLEGAGRTPEVSQ
jgi:peptide/nickel transport system ATP-binding protein/oligopeptide transport system ATP-binding protein